MRAGRVAAVLTMVVGAVGAWALPAAAAPSYTVDIDCLTSEDVSLILPVDGSVAVTATNCVAFDSDAAIVVGDLPSFTVTQATAGTSGYFYLTADPEWASGVQITLNGGAPIPTPTPSGVVLNDTATVTIPQEAPTQFVADSNAICTVASGQAATYSSAQMEVLTAGTYTLRVVDVAPTSGSVDSRQPWHPSADPVLVLYRGTFDPAQPSANLVACDDDGGWYGGSASGTAVDGLFSEIAGANLDPGLYTIVVTTYTTVSAAQWSSGVSSDGEFTPSAATTTIEVWGPDGGAVVLAAPEVVTNPASQKVSDGAKATFAAAASGYPTPTVQWQQSRDGGATWTDVAGATSTTLSFTAVLGNNGYQFRAVFTAGTDVATTTAATLTVTAVLAATGSSSQAGLMLALVLIGAGAGFVALSRRRSAVEAPELA